MNSKESKLRWLDKTIARLVSERDTAYWGKKNSLTRQIKALQEIREDIERLI